jgi:hypothetical protein
MRNEKAVPSRLFTLRILPRCATKKAAPSRLFRVRILPRCTRRDDNLWYWRNRYPEMRVGAQPMPNGNIEEQFAWNPRCQVYFEIDKASHVILGWRFEGSRQDCYLRP